MNLSENVVVVARWKARKETLGDVLRLAAELRRRSLEEPGCLGYEVFHHVDDPSALLIHERYAGGDALEAHKNSAHYRELAVERIIPLLEDRQVEVLARRA
jgi:quinol monooxygenase YgiN